MELLFALVMKKEFVASDILLFKMNIFLIQYY